MNTKAESAIRMFDSMQALRGNWDSSFREIAQSIYPMKASFQGGFSQGQRVQTTTWDGTAQRAASMLAAAIHTMMCPMTQSWFDIEDESQEVNDNWEFKVWAQNATRITGNVILHSNFHSAFHEHVLEYVIFGNGVMLQESDPDTVMRYSNRPLSECIFAENYRGNIDIMARVFEFSARQIMQKFDRVHESVRKLGSDERSESQRFKVLHLVRPMDTSNSGEYESLYIDTQHRFLMEEGRFREFPYCVSRFERASGETYGRGPGWHALPEAKKLNILEKHMTRSVQKATDPAIMVPDRLFTAPLDLAPGKVNYYRRAGNTNVQHDISPFPVGSKFDVAAQEKQELRDAINKAFYVDQLNLPMLDRMTATEVTERMMSKNYVMSPILAQMQVDTLSRVVKRSYYECVRRGLISPPPRIRGDVSLKIKYSSPLARVQRLNELRGFQQAFNAMTPLIQAQPELLEAIESNDLMRWAMDVCGGPLQIVKSAEKQAQEKQARDKQQAEMAQAQAGQQQMQGLSGLAGSIKDVAQAGKFASEAANMGMMQ